MSDLKLTGELEEVEIAATFYNQAKDLIQILAVDFDTPEEKQIHQLASMFQEAFNFGLNRGWEKLKKRITDNLFKMR